jgi:hypothetical protein
MLDALPVDSGSTTALVVMAVAISIQTIVMIGALVALAVAWKRMQAAIDERYDQLTAHLDDAVRPLQQAAHAVEHVSARAAGAIDRAGHAAGFLKAAFSAPRTAALYGAASVANALLKRWPRKRSATPRATAAGSRSIH